LINIKIYVYTLLVQILSSKTFKKYISFKVIFKKMGKKCDLNRWDTKPYDLKQITCYLIENINNSFRKLRK
jgi:hypothetical protein